jgi:hypothetical protein
MGSSTLEIICIVPYIVPKTAVPFRFHANVPPNGYETTQQLDDTQRNRDKARQLQVVTAKHSSSSEQMNGRHDYRWKGQLIELKMSMKGLVHS